MNLPLGLVRQRNDMRPTATHRDSGTDRHRGRSRGRSHRSSRAGIVQAGNILTQASDGFPPPTITLLSPASSLVTDRRPLTLEQWRGADPTLSSRQDWIRCIDRKRSQRGKSSAARVWLERETGTRVAHRPTRRPRGHFADDDYLCISQAPASGRGDLARRVSTCDDLRVAAWWLRHYRVTF